MKSNKIITFILLCGLTFLVGCSAKQSKVDMAQIKEDIPQEVRELVIDTASQVYQLEVESIEVERRLTEDGYDEIYCTLVMSNGMYQLSGDYSCEYKHYDESGWYLEDYSFGNAEIACLEDIPSDFAFYMNETTIIYERPLSNSDYYEVLNVECVRVGDGAYEFIYDVQNNGTYLNRKGTYIIKCYLKKSTSNAYRWTLEKGFSEVIDSWDIVGTYRGEERGQKCEVVIDSYNQETKEAHILSYYYVDTSPLIGGDIIHERKDFYVTAEFPEPNNLNRYPEALYLSFDVEGRYTDYGHVNFGKDRASNGHVDLERVSE